MHYDKFKLLAILAGFLFAGCGDQNGEAEKHAFLMDMEISPELPYYEVGDTTWLYLEVNDLLYDSLAQDSLWVVGSEIHFSFTIKSWSNQNQSLSSQYYQISDPGNTIVSVAQLPAATNFALVAIPKKVPTTIELGLIFMQAGIFSIDFEDFQYDLHSGATASTANSFYLFDGKDNNALNLVFQTRQQYHDWYFELSEEEHNRFTINDISKYYFFNVLEDVPY